MSAARRLAGTAAGRTLIAFAVGLLAGGVYWALGVTSPAPPPVALVGLLGILAAEAAATRLLQRLRRSREQASPPPGPAG